MLEVAVGLAGDGATVAWLVFSWVLSHFNATQR